MPDDTEDGELGSAPTTVTSVVPELRNREATQQIEVPDPAWAAQGAVPPPVESLDQTFPSPTTPRQTPRQWARGVVRGALSDFETLAPRTRLSVIAVASVLSGLILGLLIAPRGSAAPRAVDDDLVKHAKRLSLTERDAVMRALSVSDVAAALMMLRAMGVKDRVAAEPLALALRGRLALAAKDTLDALDSFEAAVSADAHLVREAWLPTAVVQTFAANKPARTSALLGKLPPTEAVLALQAACMDWQVRVRRAAQDALKNLGSACPDPVGALTLDAYQAEKCDAARAVVQKLVPLAPTDERVGAALDALSRRPGVATCVAELIPRR